MATAHSGNHPVIVVGYDGSATSRAAVEWAATRAGSEGSVFVVHAYGPPADWHGYAEYDRILRDHQVRGEAVIATLQGDDNPLASTHSEIEMLEGPAAQAILAVAETRGADEIVVGSRGHGRLASAAIGSVAQELVHRSPVPVVVIPHV
jgi:nucleotide-binding universal stress UspA family protein